jgi:cation transport regulator ChaB
MPYLRIRQDLAIPLTSDLPDDATPKQIRDALPQELQDIIVDYYQKIQRWKSYAVKINDGQNSEELSITATYEICRHDIGEPCSPQTEI